MAEIRTFYIKAFASAGGYTGDDLADHLENGPLHPDESGVAVDVTNEIERLRLALETANARIADLENPNFVNCDGLHADGKYPNTPHRPIGINRLYPCPACEARAELDRMSGWIGKLRKAEAERDAAVALIREVAGSGVEFEDERVRYVAVQIDRETWVGVRALSQKGAPE